MPPGHQRDLRAGVLRRGELGVGDHLADRGFAGRVGIQRQRRADAADHALGQRHRELLVGRDQLGLDRILREAVGAHDHVVGRRIDHVAGLRVEDQVDLRHDGAVLVAAGDQPAVDAAVVGAVRVAADHQVDRLVEVLHDLDDRPADARALVVVAGRHAAFVDQHDDRLDALFPQLGHQRVDGLGLVAEGRARPRRPASRWSAWPSA